MGIVCFELFGVCFILGKLGKALLFVILFYKFF